jgi:hypothetical protein
MMFESASSEHAALRVLAIGSWTPAQTHGGLGNPYEDACQIRLARSLRTHSGYLVLIVCEWGTSSRCIWCILYGDHKGDIDLVRLTKMRRTRADGSSQFTRCLYCEHCGRMWNRDEHGALAIRVNLLWFMKYGVYHPMLRPPYVKYTHEPAGLERFHQKNPVPLRHKAPPPAQPQPQPNTAAAAAASSSSSCSGTCK